ncbi:MAG TPA: hypothetical protein VHJ20_14375 [Polyangia bacterium]|nr:hypothetical protein [Polyangia bacterium]
MASASRFPQRGTFIVPPATTSALAPEKPAREPFVLVPAEMVIDDDNLEPHWLPAIDKATD